MIDATDPVPRRRSLPLDRPTVFIVGCPRSGTNWVKNILARHPRVVSGDESHLFPTVYQAFAGSGPATERRAAALRAYDRWVRGEKGLNSGPQHWVSRERLCEVLDDLVLDGAHKDDRMRAARTAIGTILEEHARSVGGDETAVLVEKTPGHLYHARTILQWWPNARIVEMVRDGRDVCTSLEHKSRVSSWAPADRTAQAEEWVRAIRHGAAVREEPVARGRWITMRYEVLSADPGAEVRRLLDFACLHADDELVETIVKETAFSAMARPGAEHHVRKGVVGDHVTHFSAADHCMFRSIAGDTFEAAGYRF
jgi:3-phenylpropionate/cinnamic acid dioxygenase small subunit